MPNLHKEKNNADFYIITAARQREPRRDDDNNINSQRTVKNRLSPAQSNTGK